MFSLALESMYGVQEDHAEGASLQDALRGLEFLADGAGEAETAAKVTRWSLCASPGKGA